MVLLKKLNIKSKVLITVLSLVLISFIIMGSLNYIGAKNSLTTQMEDQALNMAQAQSENIDNWLKIRLAEVTTLASTGIVRNMDVDQIKPGLVYHHERLKEFYELLYVAEPDGTCHLSTGETNNITDRDYFRQAMAGKTLVSDPVVSKATGNPIVVAIAPIKNDQGKVIGAFGGVVLIDTLNRMVSEVKIGETGYAYMLQQDGLTLVHPDKNWVLKKNLLKEADTDSNLLEHLTQMSKGETGLGYYLWDGDEKLISYAPVKTTGWGLAVTVPTKEINASINALAQNSLIVGALCLFILGLALSFMIQLLIKPLLSLNLVSQKIAAGDLSEKVEVNSDDEVGQLAQNFNIMVDNLRGLVEQISTMTVQVADATGQLAGAASETGTAAEQVAISMGELAHGTANEAELTQDAAGVVNEMSQALQQVELGAKQIDQVSQNFQVVVNEGMDAVKELDQKMAASVDSSAGVENAIRDLDQQSKEIGNIVEVITNIAGQTNLLALNAAIEAARAGEQGRGFAVVADEVRKLAEGSAQAANQIAQIIQDIQKGTETAVNEVVNAITVIRAQEQAVITTENLFNNIGKGVESIQQEISSTLTALNQLDTQAQRIVQAVESISAITQESAASTEEVSAITEEQTASVQMIASSAQEISNLVKQLENAVDSFKLNDN
ncbi:MAG: methyl-accepting chemotaxis protein [Syntrophomonadaceae bacterium]|nr:methyl-accepting chemotaxis protein [Syntrophomonadaceae bacterium]